MSKKRPTDCQVRLALFLGHAERSLAILDHVCPPLQVREALHAMVDTEIPTDEYDYDSRLLRGSIFRRVLQATGAAPHGGPWRATSGAGRRRDAVTAYASARFIVLHSVIRVLAVCSSQEYVGGGSLLHQLVGLQAYALSDSAHARLVYALLDWLTGQSWVNADLPNEVQDRSAAPVPSQPRPPPVAAVLTLNPPPHYARADWKVRASTLSAVRPARPVWVRAGR